MLYWVVLYSNVISKVNFVFISVISFALDLHLEHLRGAPFHIFLRGQRAECPPPYYV